MEKNKFRIDTDHALFYLNYLNEHKNDIDLLISFFEELPDFIRKNNELSPSLNLDVTQYYELYAISNNLDTKRHYLYEFTSKYLNIFEYIANNVFNGRNDRFYAIVKIFNIKNYLCGYNEDDINTVIAFLKYVKANYNNLSRITDAVTRIGEANICAIEMGNKQFKKDGRATIDFQHRIKVQSGNTTFCPFTNGKVTSITDKGNIFQYSYKDADFLINLEIDPVYKKQFDLDKDLGFYKQKFNGYEMTNNAVSVNSIFDSEDRVIYVDNLLFDSKSLPAPFTLDETLYKILPGVKDHINFNRRLYNCHELLKFLQLYIDLYNINEENISELANIKYKDGRNLLECCLDLKMEMIQLGFKKYSHVKLVKKNNKK